MMEHSEIMELLPAYVDQELGIAETLTVQRHLDTCTECRREYAEQSALSKRVRRPDAKFKAIPPTPRRLDPPRSSVPIMSIHGRE